MDVRSDTGLAAALAVTVSRLARQARADLGLPPGELAALMALEENPGMTLTGLATREHVNKSSMIRFVAALKMRAFVVRLPVPALADRREVPLAVTDQGITALRRARHEARLTALVRELPPGQQDVLRAAIPILDRLSHG